MADTHTKVREVAWSELFPWLMLLRTVRISLMARVLVLGAKIAGSLPFWRLRRSYRGVVESGKAIVDLALGTRNGRLSPLRCVVPRRLLQWHIKG